MNANQVLITAGLIAENYGQLKIDDLKLCFNQAKMGVYGQPYRIDGNVIFSWLNKYIEDRVSFAENRNYQSHISETANERRSESFQEIINKHKTNKL